MENKKQKNYGFWNWGTGITIAIVTGILLMSFLVYKTTTVSYEMSEPDYYGAELKYEQKQHAIANADGLSVPVKIFQSATSVSIELPKECTESNAIGNIMFYRPSNQKDDLKIAFNRDNGDKIEIDKSKLVSGIYKIKTDWQMNGKVYYNEQSVFVEK